MNDSNNHNQASGRVIRRNEGKCSNPFGGLAALSIAGVLAPVTIILGLFAVLGPQFGGV